MRLSTPRIVHIGAIIIAGAFMAGLVGGCAGPGGGGTYGVAAAGSGSCKQLRKRMNRLYGQGKQDGPEYRRVLDAYLARGCYR